MAAERGYTFPCFKDKVIVITGSSSGIGETTAIEFAKDGAKLAITGRNSERLNKVADKCLASGAPPNGVLAMVGDVTDAAFNERFIQETVTKLGGVDVLVNNARAGNMRPAGEFDEGKLDQALKIGINSVYYIIKAALPHLKKSRGSIVNTTSIVASTIPAPFMMEYCLAKSGLQQITSNLAYELAQDGININSVQPGITENPTTKGSGFHDIAKTKSGFNRVGLPLDVASAIQFLASPAAAYITGTELVVDGGQSKRPIMLPQEMQRPPASKGPETTTM